MIDVAIPRVRELLTHLAADSPELVETDPLQLADRMVASIPVRHRYGAVLGPFYDTTGLRKWLGLTRQALASRVRAGSLLACPPKMVSWCIRPGSPGATAPPCRICRRSPRSCVYRRRLRGRWRRGCAPPVATASTEWTPSAGSTMGVNPSRSLSRRAPTLPGGAADKHRRAASGRACPSTAARIDGFPAATIRADKVIYRAHRATVRPWWFCSCGDCQFDLSALRGYVLSGRERVAVLREAFGGVRLIAAGVVDQHELTGRVISAMRRPDDIQVANTTPAKAASHGVTPGDIDGSALTTQSSMGTGVGNRRLRRHQVSRPTFHQRRPESPLSGHLRRCR